MYSNIVPFENIVDAVKDETGITNLTNLYPTLRRLIYRCERDIGFGYGLIIKKVRYSIADGTIVSGRIKLPQDLIKIESFGTCEGGLCPGKYVHQGNFLFFCSSIPFFDLVYYTMLNDGNGNPCVTENHFDCVVAGIKFYLYQPKLWNNEGNLNFGRELKQYYFDRIGEAIGDDVMPTTKEEWSQIAGQLRMSYRDTLIYDQKKNCYCAVPIGINDAFLPPEEEQIQDGSIIYYWQYNDLISNISLAPDIDEAFLDVQDKVTLSSFLSGVVIAYEAIGRVAFAIKNTLENHYYITDVFGVDITSIVFDTYYNETLKTQIYISKEYYTFGNIYYKLMKN